ncbi:alpha/beta hydrolase [Spirillospora sp. NPDC047279]|uniref:alpha/beta hydrolase n=1 Tax=Spirillospora sp. NPDC047279 TaxID=3155478 RepID=UPI003409828F
MLLAAFGLAACGGDTEARTVSATSLPSGLGRQQPSWKACSGLPATAPGQPSPASGFECATVKVPLDYDKPGGETIDLALIRAKATGPGGRIGSLVFNFGGPGGSGVDALAQAAGGYKKLNTRYDLVSFDPRGVGKSAPVTCVDDQRMDQIAAMDSSPDDTAEEKAFTAEQAAYDRACEARSGKVLPYVGTLDAARDLDVIRTSLGDARLNYFGISYGTWLGGNYAHQLPAQVGRAVLDGAVDTKISTENLSLQQATAFQRALGNFAAACAQLGEASCPLGTNADEVVASVRTLLNGLDSRPLPTGSGRNLTQSLGTTGVLAALYSKQLWPVLGQGLAEAVDSGEGTTLLALADLQLGRNESGHYNNLMAANTAINCADTTDRYTTEDVRRVLPRFRNASPVFGPSMAWGILQCTGWPVEGDDASKEVSAPDAAPIVVVGNTGDPATPYAWAPGLTKELGGKATLVTLKGEGHGAYDTGDTCVQAAVDAYLLEGKVPADGTTCP